MTSTIGTLEQVDNDAPSPASAGSHRFSFSSAGAPQITDPSGNTTVLGSKFLPLVQVSASQPAPPGKTYYVTAPGVTLQLPLGHDGDTFSVFAPAGNATITIAASGANQIQNDEGISAASIVLPTSIGYDGVFSTWLFAPFGSGVWFQVSRQEYPPNRQRGGLPTVLHGGGPLAAQSNTAYRVTADGNLTLPVGLVLGTVRVAFVKDYVGSGPTLLAAAGPLTDSTTGLPVASEDLTAYGPGTRLEYAYDDTLGRWQLIARVVPTATSSDSGTYTPTLTNVLNTISNTPYSCQWMRVGSVVTVSGKVTITAVGGITQTQFRMSLPIGSSFTQNQQCAGTGLVSVGGQIPVGVRADIVNNEAFFEWYSISLGPLDCFFTFTYLIN